MTDATRLRFGDAAKRLTGGRIQYTPPADWKCGVEPTPALPIDETISELRQSNRLHRLRPREELSARGIVCPYYAARWATALAVDAATVAAGDDPKDMVRRWSMLERSAQQARDGIKGIADLLTTAQAPVTRWPLLEANDIQQAYDVLIRVLHQSGVLDRMVQHAHQSRRVFQGNQGDKDSIWRLVFAADLGFTWRVLTNSPPAETEPFMSFVAAAFNSLTDDPKPVSWERSIRRALALELDWDRYEKEFLQKVRRKKFLQKVRRKNPAFNALS
jgi:hypothetical protein